MENYNNVINIENFGETSFSFNFDPHKTVEHLEECIKEFGEKADRCFAFLDQVADSLEEEDCYEEALKVRRAQLTVAQTNRGEKAEESLLAINRLVFTLTQLGELQEALSYQQQLVAHCQELYGEEADSTRDMTSYLEVLQKQLQEQKHLDTLMKMSDLVNQLLEQGEVELALQQQTNVLNRSKLLLGKDHPYTILSLSNLGNAITHRACPEAYEEAQKLHQKALKQALQEMGEQDLWTLGIMFNLAETLFSLYNVQEAVTLAKRVLTLAEEICEEDDPFLQQVSEALEVYTQAL